ncbi:MAG: flippase-like domain-containing protein [Chloroflexi bacterium]|nr:flippase-like domain-containing protein [Chloroflexota bacterium]
MLSVLTLIPSVSGLGPREMMAPLLFTAAGVNAETAVSLSFLVFLSLRLSGILGCPFTSGQLSARGKGSSLPENFGETRMPDSILEKRIPQLKQYFQQNQMSLKTWHKMVSSQKPCSSLAATPA